MKTILKYAIPKTGGNVATLRMPESFRILHVGSQFTGVRDEPRVWILQDDVRDEVGLMRKWITIRAVHTGAMVLPEYGDYIGTVVMDRGAHVTHYFLTL